MEIIRIMEKGDLLLAVMMMFMSLLFGVIFAGLINLGARIDEISVEQARLILCHDNLIIPCK